MAITAAQVVAKAAKVIQDHGEDVAFVSYSDPAWNSNFGDSQRTATPFTARAVVYDEVVRERGGEPLRAKRRRAIVAAEIAIVPRTGDEITVREITTRILEVVTHEYRGVLISYGLELEG